MQDKHVKAPAMSPCSEARGAKRPSDVVAGVSPATGVVPQPAAAEGGGESGAEVANANLPAQVCTAEEPLPLAASTERHKPLRGL